MVCQSEIEKMDIYEQKFYKKFIEKFKDIDFEINFERSLKIIIHSEFKEFGAIYIRFDGDEFTVGIGEYFHCHFDWEYNEEIDEDAFLEAVDRLLNYLENIFANKIVLWLAKKDDKVTGACGTYNKEFAKDEREYFKKLEGQGIEIVKLTWSNI